MKYKSSLIISLFLGVTVFAQEKQVSSLLSNIGLGLAQQQQSMAQEAMGGVHVVDNNNYEIASIANPALLADLKLTSFSFALKSLGSKVATQNNKFNSGSVAISDLSLAFPIKEKAGFALGLRLNNALGFEVADAENYNSGVGSVNEFYSALGVKLFKGFSLGGQSSVFFGNSVKKQVYKGLLKATVNEDNYNVNGYAFKLGVNYKFVVNKKMNFQFGDYVVLANDINATGTNDFYEATDLGGGNYDKIEGSGIVTDIVGVQKNPIINVVGVGLGKENKWFVGMQAQQQKSISYEGAVFSQTENHLLGAAFEPSAKYAMGGYWIPKKFAIKNYYQRISYRLGFNYDKTGLVLNNNSVYNKAITVGFGLPVGKNNSLLNLVVNTGTLGNVKANLYEEKFVNVGVNFVLSDKWFKKKVIE